MIIPLMFDDDDDVNLGVRLNEAIGTVIVMMNTDIKITINSILNLDIG